jgi:hypothetical protein
MLNPQGYHDLELLSGTLLTLGRLLEPLLLALVKACVIPCNGQSAAGLRQTQIKLACVIPRHQEFLEFLVLD